MQRPGSALIVIIIVMLGSVVLAGVASTIALARAGSDRLEADLSSALRADYSADPNSIRLAPLSRDIIDAAREDSENLEGRRGEPHQIPIFYPSGAAPSPTPRSQPTATPEVTPTTVSSPTLPPTPPPTPGPTPSVPVATPTPTAASTPNPTDTATPTPTCPPADPVYAFVQTVTPADGAAGVPVSP